MRSTIDRDPFLEPRPFGRGSWGGVMTSSKNLKLSNQHEIWSRDIIWREEFKNRGPERGGAVFWGWGSDVIKKI